MRLPFVCLVLVKNNSCAFNTISFALLCWFFFGDRNWTKLELSFCIMILTLHICTLSRCPNIALFCSPFPAPKALWFYFSFINSSNNNNKDHSSNNTSKDLSSNNNNSSKDLSSNNKSNTNIASNNIAAKNINCNNVNIHISDWFLFWRCSVFRPKDEAGSLQGPLYRR